MGDEADYISSSFEPNIDDYVEWGIIHGGQVEHVSNSIWGDRSYLKHELLMA